MDPHRGFHRHIFNKRQSFGGLVGGLFPNGQTSSATRQGATTSGNSPGLGGIVGGLTSLVGDLPTVSLPSLGPSSTPTDNTPLTHSSSSSTGSITTSASSVQTTTSTSTTPSLTPTSTPSHSDTIYATSDGTSVVYVASTLFTPSATTAPHTSFLQNPSMEVGVFTLVGVVALFIICVVVTCILRKRRRVRLERDLAAAITFDPGATEHYERQEGSMEKYRLSGSSSGHSHGYDYGTHLPYAPQQEYHGPSGYGPYPMVAFNAPVPGPVPYCVPSPTVPQPAGQGGANLMRKYSDRKPVPPLLPNPAHDPSNTHVSIPAQVYQQ